MFKKPRVLYIALLVSGFILLFLLSHFALHPLYEADITPQQASARALQFIGYYNIANLVIYVVLMLAANSVYRNSSKGIYLFYSWLFFSLLTLFSYIYMTGEHFRFIKKTGIWSGGFEVGFLIGFALILVAGLAAIINYIVLRRITKKQHEEREKR